MPSLSEAYRIREYRKAIDAAASSHHAKRQAQKPPVDITAPTTHVICRNCERTPERCPCGKLQDLGEIVKRSPLHAAGSSETLEGKALGTSSDIEAYILWHAAGCNPHPVFAPRAWHAIAYDEFGVMLPLARIQDLAANYCVKCDAPKRELWIAGKRYGCTCAGAKAAPVKPVESPANNITSIDADVKPRYARGSEPHVVRTFISPATLMAERLSRHV